MESNDVGQKTKSSSGDELLENQLLHSDSLTCAVTSKRQLQELDEDIQNAESNHDSIKMRWDLLKSLRSGDIYNESESVLPERSFSSLSDQKVMLSDRSYQREEAEHNYYDANDDETENVNQVQIVLTPRSQISNVKNRNDIPNLQIRVEKSHENVSLNKKVKKVCKLKKKFSSSRIIQEPLKTSSNTSKRKRKKLHGRLRACNSKSTVTTRETSLSDKKNDRRKFKKQKSFDRLSVFQTPQYRKRVSTSKMRELQNSNSKDFVEIYHNNALKSGSFSVVSGRQSKGRAPQSPRIDEEISEPISDTETKQDFSSNEKSVDKVLNTMNTDTESKDEKFIKNQEQIQEDAYYHPGFYDSLYQRSYEMPTMASKMKRVDRSYCHRYNIRHIPFVVGTSISPSHNLGLNIQQVLSIIKTKQPSIPGISPLLIRNVSKGIRPVTSLFEQINEEFAKSCRALNIDDSNRISRNNLRINQGISSLSCEQFRTNNLSTITSQVPFKPPFTCEPLYEEDEETHSVYSNARSNIGQRKPFVCEARLEPSASKYQQQSPCGFEKQSRLGPLSTKSTLIDSLAGNQLNPRTDKETAQVFSRLYDQFDKMITEQNKLKEQLEQRKDKTLIKEVSEMEEAIMAKQQEITTVVNLYKEVLSLKKQMKLYHERNSFVCIATQDSAYNNISRSGKFQRPAQTDGYIDSMSQLKYFPNRRGSIAHEAPYALRLTGLLRQIQAFQRQLVLA